MPVTPRRSSTANRSATTALRRIRDRWAEGLPNRVSASVDGGFAFPDPRDEAGRWPHLALWATHDRVTAALLPGSPAWPGESSLWAALEPVTLPLLHQYDELSLVDLETGHAPVAGASPKAPALVMASSPAPTDSWADRALSILRQAETEWQEAAGLPLAPPPAGSIAPVHEYWTGRAAELIAGLLESGRVERRAPGAYRVEWARGDLDVILDPEAGCLRVSVAGQLESDLETGAAAPGILLPLAAARELWADRVEAAAWNALPEQERWEIDRGHIELRGPDLFVVVDSGDSSLDAIAALVRDASEHGEAWSDALTLPAGTAALLRDGAPGRLLVGRRGAGCVDLIADIAEVDSPAANGRSRRASRLRLTNVHPVPDEAMPVSDLVELDREHLDRYEPPPVALALYRPDLSVPPVVAPEDGGAGIDTVSPEVSARKQARVFWPYLRPYWWQSAVVMLLVVGTPGLAVGMLGVLKQIVTDVIGNGRTRTFGHLLLVYIGLLLLRIVFDFTNQYLSSWTSGRFTADLRKSVYAHIQSLDQESLHGIRQGDLLTRITADSAAMDNLVLGGATDAIQSIATVFWFGGFVLLLSPPIALTVAVISPIFILISRIFGRRVRTTSRLSRRRSSQVLSAAEEGLSGMTIVHAYNRQDFEVSRFTRRVEQAFTVGMQNTLWRSLYATTIQSLVATLTLVVISVIVYLITVSPSSVDSGALFVIIIAISAITSPVRTFGKLNAAVQSALASGERLIELFNTRARITDPGGDPPSEHAEGAIAFERVEFSYRPERPLMRGVEFNVRPGEMVALVGASGAGKTTAMKLLMRFYDPQKGRVTLDGHDLRMLPLNWVRDQVGVVLSDPFLFNDTVRANILFGRPDATDAEVEAAAAIPGVLEIARDLPKGLDTRVGVRGSRLSTGQQQRVAIARAILKNAPILVLDEAMAGIDAQSEGRIQDALNRLMKGRTVIVIAHRLSTVQAADRIVVIEAGRVAQVGTHAQLAKQEGPYRALYLRQMHSAA
ncbi:MAG: ABC transporter ATP-binding protein [Candidatus Dormibacteria bacterium]